MIRKLPFSYCLLQYEHDPWLKERLNIGVLLMCEEAQFVELKTRGHEGRLFRAYPDLARSAFTEDLKQMQRSIKAHVKQSFIQPTLFSSDAVHQRSKRKAHVWASGFLPDADSSYRWEAGGVGLCSCPREKLSSLFDRFVVPFDKPKPPTNRSDDQVWSSLSKAISDQEISQFVDNEPTVRTGLGEIKFQAGYQNGAYHLIQPLSFDLADEDNVSAKTAKWAGYAMSAMEKQSADYVPHFVLGAPTRAKLDSSFRRSKNYLEHLVGPQNVVLEEDSEKFAQTMSAQISSH